MNSQTATKNGLTIAAGYFIAGFIYILCLMGWWGGFLRGRFDRYFGENHGQVPAFSNFELMLTWNNGDLIIIAAFLVLPLTFTQGGNPFRRRFCAYAVVLVIISLVPLLLGPHGL